MATLKELVSNSSRIVFFGGAGVSTESGIPDFRSQDGLYNQKYSVPPETILSDTYFYSHTEEFYRFYRDKMLPLNAEPNAAHKKLAEWEQEGKLLAVVTQNIDGLHQKAGSKRVYELHGSIYRNHCLSCGKRFSAEYIKESAGIPPLRMRRHHQARRRPLRRTARREYHPRRRPRHCVLRSSHRGGHVALRLSRRKFFKLFPRGAPRAHQPRQNTLGRRV